MIKQAGLLLMGAVLCFTGCESSADPLDRSTPGELGTAWFGLEAPKGSCTSPCGLGQPLMRGSSFWLAVSDSQHRPVPADRFGVSVLDEAVLGVLDEPCQCAADAAAFACSSGATWPCRHLPMLWARSEGKITIQLIGGIADYSRVAVGVPVALRLRSVTELDAGLPDETRIGPDGPAGLVLDYVDATAQALLVGDDVPVTVLVDDPDIARFTVASSVYLLVQWYKKGTTVVHIEAGGLTLSVPLLVY